MVVDYEYGKIYKIWSPLTDKIYIGSTTQPLCNRMSNHRTCYKLWLKGYVRPSGMPASNCSSFRILEIDPDCKIELLKKFPCNNKTELENEERAIMDLLDNCVNVNKGKSFDPEYMKNYKKKYWSENKDKINECRNEKFDCDCGGRYTRAHKSRHYISKKHKKYIDN